MSPSSSSSSLDLNQQIQQLDEKKLQVTFRDIWLDYQNFRRNYYFFQLPTPKEIYEQNEVPVDTANFSLSRWFWELIKNTKKHPYMSPSYYFVRILWLISIFVIWRIGRQPFEWYYHWKDPLTSGQDGGASLGSAEDLRERAKYKTRAKDWQN